MPRTVGSAAALAACALLVAVSGCGGDGEPRGAGDTAASSPSGSPSLSIPETPPVGSASTAELPDSFPLPPGTEKTVNGTKDRIAAQLTVEDGADAYDFWLKKLPKKGYTVTSNNKVDVAGTKATIAFHGHGYPSGHLAINDTAVALAMSTSKGGGVPSGLPSGLPSGIPT